MERMSHAQVVGEASLAQIGAMSPTPLKPIEARATSLMPRLLLKQCREGGEGGENGDRSGSSEPVVDLRPASPASTKNLLVALLEEAPLRGAEIVGLTVGPSRALVFKSPTKTLDLGSGNAGDIGGFISSHPRTPACIIVLGEFFVSFTLTFVCMFFY